MNYALILQFPEQWLESREIISMFYPTPESCCEFYAPGMPGGRCQIHNYGCEIDEGLKCDANVWHPYSDGRSGGCTNEKGYPSRWRGSDGVYLFESAKECCQEWHEDGVCEVADGCMGVVVETMDVTEEPTRSPSKAPTATVSDCVVRATAQPLMWQTFATPQCVLATC